MARWSERALAWSPPAHWRRVLAVDAHTEGEPLRVVLSGFPELEGRTMLEKRRLARERHDDLRRALMWEPRGHADMYGCIVVPPVTPTADIGVLFTHNEGFSTMCGHGIIGVATVLVDLDLLREPAKAASEAEHVEIGIDTPAGFVRATAFVENRRTSRVSFRNVPSFVAGLDLAVDVAGTGPVRYDLAFGGAFYAYVSAEDFGLELVPGECEQIVRLGRAIKQAVQSEAPPEHPTDPELGFLYGTIFVGPPQAPEAHSRNVCVFADGEVDRCPTGTGVSGRLAIHHERGELAPGEEIEVESILGTRFSGRIVGESVVGTRPAIVPEVSGRAFVTGRNELFVDPDDPLGSGFLLT